MPGMTQMAVLAAGPSLRRALGYYPYELDRSPLADAQDALTMTREALVFSPLRSHRQRGAALLPLVSLALAVGFLFAGCGPVAGPATLRVDAESVASLLAYRDGAETAVAGLLGAYEEAGKRELGALAELDRRDATRAVTEWTEDGKPVTVQVVPAAEADALLVSYAAGRDRLAAEVARFRVAWEVNAENVRDALELRAELRRFLEIEGVSAADVDALADGIADHLHGMDR